MAEREMERDFPGEPYPAAVMEHLFCGVVCARIIGTEREIRLTTDLYTARYPVETCGTENWGDARFVAYGRSDDQDIYELLVFRRNYP